MSSATDLFNQDQLQILLRESRRRNEAEGITGLLAYSDGTFLRAIEGEKKQVEDLFSRISKDRRHHNIITLFNEGIPAREFGDWTMAFRDTRMSPEIADGFNALLNGTQFESDLDLYPAKVRAFLRALLR